MNLENIHTLHVLFIPTGITAVIILLLRFFKHFRLIISPHYVDAKDVQSLPLRKLYSLTNQIIVQSRRSYDILKPINGNITIIPPFMDLFSSDMPPFERKFQTKKELGIPGDFTVIFPGEYQLIQDIQQFCEMVEITLQKDAHISFVIACRLKNNSDFRIKKSIQDRLKKHSNIFFIDTTPIFEKYLSVSDVCIFPAKHMQYKFDLPLAIIEAIGYEMPIIVSDISPLNEIYQNQKDGLLAKRYSDFPQMILDLKRNEPFYQKQKSIAVSLKHFYSSLEIVHRHQTIYDQLNHHE
ncbi:MAG: glycosyltransferase [Candidatus Omnitrophica bacterium]|nr:glycosyltransferase [Candidatus Omnitrophota bacterium]